MNNNSRTHNTLRNIISGLINRGIMILLPFINRTAILWLLGAEFTGLTGLFTSVLSVLSLAELGFNSAIVYSLYEPMAKRDETTICALVTLFRRVYHIIGTVILIGGLCILPFISRFIHGNYPSAINIYILFGMYLANAVISYYLFAYKAVLLTADQRQDIINNIRTTVHIITYLIQLVVLIATRNFYMYVLIAILSTIGNNLLIQYITLKRYSFFKRLAQVPKMPAALKKQIYGLAINKLSDTCRNSFDSIIISSFLGLTATAIYGNYYYVYSALYGVMMVIANSMGASVGNCIVKKDTAYNYNQLLLFSLLFTGLLACVCSCMACLYQPFMQLWAGESLLLPTTSMLLFCLYFYVINLNNIRNQYVSGTGLWWKLKGPYVVEAIGNLGLNIVLGKLYGINGILWATIITIFCFNFLWRTDILFHNYFKGYSQLRFLGEQFYYALVTILCVGCTYGLCIVLFTQNTVLSLLGRGALCALIAPLIFIAAVCFMPRFKQAQLFIDQILTNYLKTRRKA